MRTQAESDHVMKRKQQLYFTTRLLIGSAKWLGAVSSLLSVLEYTTKKIFESIEQHRELENNWGREGKTIKQNDLKKLRENCYEL